MTEQQFVDARINATRPGRAGWKDRAAVAARSEYRALREKEGREQMKAAYAAQAAAKAAEKAADDAAGIVRLRHIYGPSYFGSGGGYGRAAGINAVVAERGDNGFMAGPSAFRVVDATQPAEVWAQGGDSIGREGRTWREAYRWDPIARTWSIMQLEEARLAHNELLLRELDKAMAEIQTRKARGVAL